MAAAVVTQAAAGLAASRSSCSSSSNLLASSSSRQHFQFPVSAWTSSHSLGRVATRSRGIQRYQCHAVEGNNDGNGGEGNDEEHPEVSGGIDDAVLGIKSVSTRKLEEYIASSSSSSANVSCEDKEWKSWQEHFPKVEEEDNLISALKFQLDDAVKMENFQDAAKLKRAIEAAKANDVISEVNKELQRALQEERYKDAARLRDEAGAGLVGWWAGIAKDGSDPFGRIIRVRAAHGRLVAQNYTARQLGTAAQKSTAEGDPLFEVFVKREDNGFNKQVVYLQRPIEADADLDKLVDIDIDEIVQQAEKIGAEEEKKMKNSKESAGKTDKPPKDRAEDITDDVEASGIVSFLKDRIPDLNMRVIKVIAPEGSEPDIPKIIEEIIEKEQREHQGKNDAPAVGGIVIQDSSDLPPGKADDGKGSSDKAVTIRVVIGGAAPGEGGDGENVAAVRVPATIKQESIDSFVLHIDSIPDDVHGDDSKSWKVARIATKASADQMPDDVAQKLWNVEKVPVQVSKELKDVIKLAVNQAQKMQSLPKTTVFHRIDVTESSDPFTGLYVGAFGANTPEILQLKRKYGHWDTKRSVPDDKLKFYEYVEAVKLTGDLNVPAGQVSFRARISKENKMSPLGIYPEELGVVARYKGQGQLADPGFKHPKWTDGELVLLDGRTSGPTNGARLGFVFYLPDHHFLILFDRLNLEKMP